MPCYSCTIAGPKIMRDPGGAVSAAVQHWLNNTRPPKVLWRTTAALVLGGQVMIRILRGARLLSPGILNKPCPL